MGDVSEVPITVAICVVQATSALLQHAQEGGVKDGLGHLPSPPGSPEPAAHTQYGAAMPKMAAHLERKRAIISIVAAGAAPYGYKKDGAARKQMPGPGRPRLSAEERAKRRKASKAAWQGRHLDYMRDYMRARRAALRGVNDTKQ